MGKFVEIDGNIINKKKVERISDIGISISAKGPFWGFSKYYCFDIVINKKTYSIKSENFPISCWSYKPKDTALMNKIKSDFEIKRKNIRIIK